MKKKTVFKRIEIIKQLLFIIRKIYLRIPKERTLDFQYKLNIREAKKIIK